MLYKICIMCYDHWLTIWLTIQIMSSLQRFALEVIPFTICSRRIVQVICVCVVILFSCLIIILICTISRLWLELCMHISNRLVLVVLLLCVFCFCVFSVFIAIMCLLMCVCRILIKITYLLTYFSSTSLRPVAFRQLLVLIRQFTAVQTLINMRLLTATYIFYKRHVANAEVGKEGRSIGPVIAQTRKLLTIILVMLMRKVFCSACQVGIAPQLLGVRRWQAQNQSVRYCQLSRYVIVINNNDNDDSADDVVVCFVVAEKRSATNQHQSANDNSASWETPQATITSSQAVDTRSVRWPLYCSWPVVSIDDHSAKS